MANRFDEEFMELDVYALGNALVDIQIQVQNSQFAELGLEKGNRYLTDRYRQEEILQKLLGPDSLESAQKAGKLQTAAGGSAANTMYGISQLGGRAGLCGKIANDGLGILYAEHMRQCSVVFKENTGQGMTGTCVVLISEDAQRTMLTCLGVSGEIDYEDIDEELLKHSRYIFLEGYLFESECAARTMLRAVAVARNNGVKIALSASDANCVDRHRDLLVQLIQNDVDLLFANTREAWALSGTDNNDAALRVLSSWCEGVAVTDGEHGSMLSFNGEVMKNALYSVSALDTTGAGDAYAAGLLYGIISGRKSRESGMIASLFSARVVAQIGPRYNGDIQAELKKLL
ncbi:MAG: adenosine kinase [Planctomycetes bacterium]|nr:adenosine kinase [Planctomycetota bacterium]